MPASHDAPLHGPPDGPLSALGSVVLVLSGPLALESVAEVCETARLLLESTGAGVLTCDVAAIGSPDAGTVDVLARVALTVRRLGRAIHLLDPCPRLQALLTLTGLEVALPYSVSPPPDGRA